MGAVLINWSVAYLVSSATLYWWVALAMVVVGAWGLATAAVCWLPVADDERWQRWRALAAWATVAVMLATFALWAVTVVRSTPSYSIDEVAFDQYAGLLASHGVDPYLRSMAPSFALYNVPPTAFTYHLDGAPVTSLSYPALSFLPYVPFLLAGWSTQLAVALNVAAWCIAIAVMFALLPRGVRPLALVIGAVTAYISFSLSGVSDILYMPFLLGAAYKWASFPSRKGWRRYIGPALLGLAMCVKQTPWIDAPFLLAGVSLEALAIGNARSAVRNAAQYVAAAATAFLVPNAYYIARAPKAWLHGVLTPTGSGLVPNGEGFVGFTMFLRLGGGSLKDYTILIATVMIVLLAVYVATYRSLRPLTFLFASIVMFFAARSFGTYLVSMIPALLVGAITTAPRASTMLSSPFRSPTGPVLVLPRRAKQALATAAVVLPLSVATATLTSGQPISLSVTGLRSTGALATIEELDVRATNRLGRAVRPHFAIQEGGGLTTFWLPVGGPRALPPHASATYVLKAPNFASQPPVVGGFQVMAFTTKPRSVSASSPYIAEPSHTEIIPQAVNRFVPVGQPIVVTAQLLNPFDAPIHRQGVAVYMSQIIYGQNGLLYGEARINNSPPGQTPVVAYTDKEGRATFRVVGTQASSLPIYFQTYIVGQYPYGYSPMLTIYFSAARAR